MEEGTSLLATHLCVRITEHKSDCGEEIALPRAVAPHDDIVLWRKGFDHRLLLVAVEL